MRKTLLVVTGGNVRRGLSWAALGACLALPVQSFAAEAAALAPVPAAAPSKPSGLPKSKALVVPVVVGPVAPPPAALVEALAQGLRDNVNWDVTVPSASTPVASAQDPAASVAAVEAAATAVGRVSVDMPAAAVSETLAPAFEQLVQASMHAPLGTSGAEALVKVGGRLLSAQAASGQEEAARKTATDLKLLLPARTFREGEGVSFVAAALLQAAPTDGITAEFKANAPACAIELDGFEVGKGQATVALRPLSKYAAVARCPGKAGATEDSFVRVVSVSALQPAKEGEAPAAGPRKFALDASFPSHLRSTPDGLLLAFDNSQQRVAQEETYARRLAERYGVSSVVLASVGEFQSAEWLNARLYLSSGYKNRHGLARLENARAMALGRYLATGKESPGVLNAEEAGNMVAASQSLRPVSRPAPAVNPWYKDVPGWSFVGAGVASVVLGRWIDAKAEDKREEARVNTINDPFKRDKLNGEASDLKFWSGITMYGGGLLAVTGIVLLALPEYGPDQGELYGLAPLPGGAAFTYGGRF
ncbi:MAG: hypothetical protein SF187_12705 [Deltaproteobacteria bacterium]|nr:hypothetical protein [Deltaproteobacteria bacterium]